MCISSGPPFVLHKQMESENLTVIRSTSDHTDNVYGVYIDTMRMRCVGIEQDSNFKIERLCRDTLVSRPG